MLNNSELFDLSNYDNHKILYDMTNNKLLVNLNQSPNKQITNLIGLCSKLYSYEQIIIHVIRDLR